MDSLLSVYAAISSNTPIRRKPPKSNLMHTERPDSITGGVGGSGKPRLRVVGSNDNAL